MSRKFKIGGVEELRPLTYKDFSREQVEKLAKAVLTQSIGIIVGLKQDHREFSPDREIAFWTQLSKDNLWFQILADSEFGVDDARDMANKVLSAEPAEVRAKYNSQQYSLTRRRRFK